VIANDNTVELRRVEMGPRVERDWIVETGLEAGERIALEGLQRLRSGMKVIPATASESGQQKE
jgi:membrane fusion protein (multidrug efflux system)